MLCGSAGKEHNQQGLSDSYKSSRLWFSNHLNQKHSCVTHPRGTPTTRQILVCGILFACYENNNNRIVFVTYMGG